MSRFKISPAQHRAFLLALERTRGRPQIEVARENRAVTVSNARWTSGASMLKRF